MFFSSGAHRTRSEFPATFWRRYAEAARLSAALANVNTMKVTREETFGPVAPLFRFKDEKESIRLANDTEFGLASYYYGRDRPPG